MGEQHGRKRREVASFSGLQEIKMRESKQGVLKIETCKTVAARCSSPDHAAGILSCSSIFFRHSLSDKRTSPYFTLIVSLIRKSSSQVKY